MSDRVHVAFEEQAQRTPDRVAVIASEVRMRYAGLDARANRIARELRRAGAGPGDLVGVCLGRDEHLLPTLLAVLKTGAAYVPMDPAYPAQRLAYIAADATMRLVATSRAAKELVAGLDAAAVPVDEISDEADGTALGLPGNGADAAYVIYTSGSTGRPKGVVVEHRNTMNLLRWEAAAYTAEELRGMLATASISFDPSISQLFLPLVTGGTVILAENLLALPTLPARDEVTTVYGVPSALATLLREPLPAGVQAVFAGGEPLTRALVDRIYANPGVRRVLNLYGPTECTTTCAIAEVGRDDAGEPPIGHPIAGAVMAVRDGAGNPVADGELGELWIGGPVVARGYLGQESAAFVTEADGSRVYRSGDLVRRSGGVLHFAGRGDDQVKVRGYRVELGEIEAVLERHPAVRRACVLAATDADGISHLVGHVEATGLDERSLRAWLRRRVPDHLVPTRFGVAERLPLGPNGKVDRAALPPLPARRVTETAYVAPRTPTEVALAAIVGDVLGITGVGVEDRFAELGGHSLAAARVCALAGREFGTTVALADFLAEPTVAALAAFVQGAAATSGDGPVRHEGVVEYPLTPTQRELWTLRQISPVPTVTSVAFRVRLTGRVEPAALRSALAELVARHEVLRSRIVERDGEPMTVVHTCTAVPVAEHDLRDRPAAMRAEQADALAAAAAQHALEPSGAVPLLRVDLIRLTGEVSELVVVTDHVAFDGWSTGSFLTELAAELAAPGTLDPPPLQVGDLALFSNGTSVPSVQQWRDELAGASPPSELFAGTGGFRGERLTRPVPPSLVTGLAEVCAASGTATFAGWLTGLGLLLAGFTARGDVLVGAVVARRAGPELDRVIGPLVDVLPVRLRLEPAATVRETIAAASATTARTLDRPRPSTEDLFQAVGTQPRGAMITPVVLSVQPADLPVCVEQGGLRLELLGELGCGGAQNPLTVFVNETADGTELQLEYDLDLMDRGWAEAFADRLLFALAELTADPDRPLAQLPLVTASEQAELLGRAAGPPLPVDAPATVVDAIARHVRLRPDEFAVVGADAELTYRQLWDASSEVASMLRANGTGRGDVVGVCLPRDHRLPSTLLGVWRAGAAYLPLEPELPAERLAWLAADGGVRTVLCRTATAVAAGAVAGTRTLDLDRVPAMVDAAHPTVSPEDLAYLLYTSGSTGTPKGVAVAQAGLAALTEALRLEPGIGPGDRMLAVATLSFDTSCAEIWSTLGAGACCVVVERDSAVDGYRLGERIAAHRVNVMNVPPTMLRTLLASGWAGAPGLRVWAGGEALDPALARELLPRTRELWNVYGPTEGTVLSAAYRVSEVDAAVPIGHPLPGERLYVMDPLERLAPPGVAGELWIGGAGPALGYHGRPELTAAAFVPDPVVSGGRCYRTGDLVRQRPDGELVFCGRRDDQHKIRGYRVEPGEIEAALREHPDVAHAVVTVRGQGAEAHLVGYVAGPLTAAQAAEHLRGRLPDYLVPHRWVVLDALPTLPSGKVDLAALPEPGGDGEHRPVRSAMERLVADVWTQVLGADGVGADDSFFGLGGHSLAATRVVGRLREALDRAVPVRLLFDHPVLADFAERLARLVADDTPGEPSVAAPAASGAQIPALPEPDAPQPLSSTQSRLWFHAQFEPNTSRYHVPVILRLTGPLDADALLSALREVATRHAVLRSVIVQPGAQSASQQPVTVAGPAERVELSLVQADESTLADALRVEVNRPFELDREPPMRAVLFHLGEEHYVLALTVHHIATDAWSQDLLLDEVGALYAARLGLGEPPAPPRLQYADVAAWQAARAADDHVDWWVRRLGGLAPTLALPVDRPYPAVADWTGGYVPVDLPPALCARIRESARHSGATPFMVLLAAWQALLGRLCGSEDVAVGVPESGRHHRATEGLVGCFINTLVLRTDLSGDPSGRELLARVRETTLDAFGHATAPFERIVEAIAPERSTATTPIVQAMLFLRDAPLRDPVLPAVRAERLDPPLDANKCDLSLELTGRDGGYDGYITYRLDLFDRSTVQRWAHWLPVLIDGMLSEPDHPLSRLDLLDGAQRSALLAQGTGPDLPADAPATMLDAVLAQAGARPDAVAVDGRDGTLSYADLALASARIATALRAHGAGAHAPVGICLPRDRHLPAALVGVWRAGSAYAPLEPDHPVERLRFQIGECGTGVVLAAAETLDRARAVADGTGAVVLDLAEALATPPGALPSVGPHDLAYVLYTSGSTGRPKGVEVNHGSLAAFVAAHCELMPVTPDDVMLGLTALSFDVAGLELWVALGRGLRLVLAERGTARDGHLVAQRIAESKVTVMTATPTTLRMLVAAEWQAPTVRAVAIGEVVDPTLARELTARLGEFWNGYGPTEATVTSTMYRVTAPIGDTVPIGVPMAGERVYVVDSAGRLALPGTVGELWIGGAGVARGYRERPDLTAAAFVADPMRPGERCYRTGDLVRWRTDGLLEFLGRHDQQVKVRGHRIELGEIESQLRSAPGVAEAVVAVADSGGAHLVGYLVPRPGSVVDPPGLESLLRAALPDYMVPRRWMTLPSLPVNGSGKVDRSALPEPRDEVQERVAPRSEAEQLVAEVWSAVLGAGDLSVYDNFFALGGHSLSAMLVVSRLRDALDFPVPVRLQFEQPVLANFAVALESLLLAEVTQA